MANKLLLTNAAQPIAQKNPDTLYYIDNMIDLFTPSKKTLIIGGAVALLALAGGLFALARKACWPTIVRY